jgi:hypothetical protein
MRMYLTGSINFQFNPPKIVLRSHFDQEQSGNFIYKSLLVFRSILLSG